MDRATDRPGAPQTTPPPAPLTAPPLASTPSPAPSLADSIAATLDWWREAGVDCAFTDAPQRWLAAPGVVPGAPARAALAPPKAPAPTVPERPRIGGEPGAWPRDLAAFRRWWCEEPGLAPAGAVRVPPRGEAGAALLVLVAMPDAEDGAALLSGPAGGLIAGMARAMALPEERLYLASALPRHLPLPDWDALARDGLGAVLRHHLALAMPERVLVLGTDILPLLGHDPAQASPGAAQIAVEERQVPMLASFAPAHLIGHARLRARLWRQWLDWTDEER